jgi:hypothetical protein
MYKIEYVKDETGYVYIVYIRDKYELRDLLNINLTTSLSLLNNVQNDKTISNLISLVITGINTFKVIPNKNVKNLSDLLMLVVENLDAIVDSIYEQIYKNGYVDFAIDKIKVRVKLR